MKIFHIQKHQVQRSYMKLFNAISQVFAQMAMMLRFHANGRDSCICHATLMEMEKCMSPLEPIHYQIIATSPKLHIQADHKQISMLTFYLHASTPSLINNHSTQAVIEPISMIRHQSIYNSVMRWDTQQSALITLMKLKNIMASLYQEEEFTLVNINSQ